MTRFALSFALVLGLLGQLPAQDDPVLAKIDQAIDALKIDKNAQGWRVRVTGPPEVSFPKSGQYLWQLDTNMGSMTFRLFHETAPKHVASTIWLTRMGFYDGLTFHRIIPGFMAQGGCPLGNGRGGPGYQLEGEFDPQVKHAKAGMLSMANAGPGTDGSQFFITFGPTPHLDGEKHTLFGEVVEGEKIVMSLATRGSRDGQVSEPVVIKSANIVSGEVPPGEVPIAGEPLEAIRGFIKQAIANGDIDKAKQGWKEKLPEPPLLDFSGDKTYIFEVETTGGGFRFRLLPGTAPKNVGALMYLSELGYYNDLTFHRVVKNFIAQAGCPAGTGRGNPGFAMPLEADPEVRHGARGSLGFAESGKDGFGGQFFITFRAARHLDGKYPVLGQMEKGQATLRALQQVASRDGTPKDVIRITSTRISSR